MYRGCVIAAFALVSSLRPFGDHPEALTSPFFRWRCCQKAARTGIEISSGIEIYEILHQLLKYHLSIRLKAVRES